MGGSHPLSYPDTLSTAPDAPQTDVQLMPRLFDHQSVDRRADAARKELPISLGDRPRSTTRTPGALSTSRLANSICRTRPRSPARASRADHDRHGSGRVGGAAPLFEQRTNRHTTHATSRRASRRVREPSPLGPRPPGGHACRPLCRGFTRGGRLLAQREITIRLESSRAGIRDAADRRSA